MYQFVFEAIKASEHAHRWLQNKFLRQMSTAPLPALSRPRSTERTNDIAEKLMGEKHCMRRQIPRGIDSGLGPRQI